VPLPDAPVRLVSLVLAAGEGRRMGFAKALLSWPVSSLDSDVTPAARLPLPLVHAQAHLRAGSERVVVVVRRAVADVLAGPARAMGERVHPVISDEADALGPAGSIRCGLEHLASISALAPDAWVWCTPVDAVPPERSTFEALFRAARQGGALAARPMRDGRRGHPVLVQLGVLQAYRTGEPPPLRDVLRSLGDGCRDVRVDDPAVNTNLDRPEDVRAWLGEEAGRWLGES